MNIDYTFKNEVNQEVSIRMRTPIDRDYEEADKYRAYAIARMVKDKSGTYLSRYELDDFLEKSGIWSKDDTDKAKVLSEEIEQNLKKLSKGGIGVKDGREICVKTLDLRMKFFKILGKRQAYDDSTIESLADREKMEYLAYVCTMNKLTNENYWDSFEDYKEDNSPAGRFASDNILKCIYGEEITIEKSLPENLWLKKYGYINDELRFIDRKTGTFVDREGNPISEEDEEKIQKLIMEAESEEPFFEDDGTPITFETEAKVEVGANVKL